MATVKGKTSIKIDELIESSIISGYLNSEGQLILRSRGGAEINAGYLAKPFGERWRPNAMYETGDVVGYAGIMWKALSDNTNKPPALFTSTWTVLKGESFSDWSEKDPYFIGDDLYESWNVSTKSGFSEVSLTNTEGEYESGKQALKVNLAANSSQTIFQEEENIVRGSELVEVLVRAKLVSPNPTATVLATMLQNDVDEPKPSSLTNVVATAEEGAQTLTTAWLNYYFTIRAANEKPRAMVQVLLASGTSGAASMVIDHIRVTRGGESAGPTELVQTFPMALNTWVINHNLGTKALNVKTWDSNGEEILGDVLYVDENTIHVNYYYPQTGSARIWS